MDPLLPHSVNGQYIEVLPLPLVESPPLRKPQKMYKSRVFMGTVVILGVMGLGATLWMVFMAPLLHTAGRTMAQAGPVMDEATRVMAKSEVLFKLLWQTACNGTLPLLPPEDCVILHP